MFGKKEVTSQAEVTGFNYIKPGTYYFDSACQTLRPEEVIAAETSYYHEFNACGHRVKYKWGEIVDSKVEETRSLLLDLVGKKSKDYTVAFTLNTTFGINFILHQLRPDKFSQIVTSEIEHNSVFLNSITWAKRNNKKRLVLSRLTDGDLDYKIDDIKNSVVIVNTTSNIDGRSLNNLASLAKDVRNNDGILLLDASQSFAHNVDLLKDVDFDAAFGSSHKMYGPSLGFIIIKKTLLKELDCYLLGGSTVQDVFLDTYNLIEDDADIYSRIEPGLQNFAGIIGLGEAIKWQKNVKFDGKDGPAYEKEIQIYLNEKLKAVPNLISLYDKPSSIVSIYSKKIDGHQLGIFLSSRNVMCRTGYHCCHYYLKNLKKYPPLFRISLGLNNTKEQIDFLSDSLKQLLK